MARRRRRQPDENKPSGASSPQREPGPHRSPETRRYEVQVGRSVQGALVKLSTSVQSRIDKALRTLADDLRPHGCIKMQGLDDTYRIRVGDYRIIYQVRDDRLIVLVVAVGHRRDVYRGF